MPLCILRCVDISTSLDSPLNVWILISGTTTFLCLTCAVWRKPGCWRKSTFETHRGCGTSLASLSSSLPLFQLRKPSTSALLRTLVNARLERQPPFRRRRDSNVGQDAVVPLGSPSPAPGCWLIPVKTNGYSRKAAYLPTAPLKVNLRRRWSIASSTATSEHS